MSQSQSQGRWARERARGPGSTSSHQHSQIKDMKDELGALDQKLEKLEKEFNDSNDKYNSSVAKAERTYESIISKTYKYHLAKLYDLLEKSKPEDTKKQEHEELVSAVQKSIAMKRENIRSGEFAGNLTDASRLIKSNAIREKPEVIKKLNGTPEGTQAIKDTEARLSKALDGFESKVVDRHREYLEETSKIKAQHKEIEDILNKMNIRKAPEHHAEAAERAKKLGSKDPQELRRKLEEKYAEDPRMLALKK